MNLRRRALLGGFLVWVLLACLGHPWTSGPWSASDVAFVGLGAVLAYGVGRWF